MNNIEIKEVNIEEALKVFNKIKEWDRPEAGTVEYCTKRIGDSKSIILASYDNDEIIGYLIGYEKDNSFYCWVVAVVEEYRRLGIFSEMMKIFIKRSKKLGYSKVTLKTLNNKREMLSYLVKDNWNFTKIINGTEVRLNEIVAEKELT